MAVELTEETTEDVKARDHLPVQQPMILHSLISEPCVLVTTSNNQSNPITFHLPIRTRIYTSFIKKEVGLKPPKLSAPLGITESVTKGVFASLKNETAYNQIEDMSRPKSTPPVP